MTWDTVTVMTLVSGLAVLAGALVPQLPGKDRLWSFLVGVLLAGYAVYGASMTSGTYYYSIWIFVVPVVMVVRIGVAVLGRPSATPAQSPTAQGALPAATSDGVADDSARP